MPKPSIEVCLSPALLHLYDTTDKIVVIIDVFRATSTIAAALHNGAKAVLPVSTVEECIRLGACTDNAITAGERDGKIAEGLAYGNSPSEYPATFIKDKTLVLTTTNGAKLLHMVVGAREIITGAFLNLTAVCNYLQQEGANVILGCAAWKDRPNLEDTLFAGAVVSRLSQQFEAACDSSRAARDLHTVSNGNYLSYLKDSAHYYRLARYGLEADLAYCSTPDLHPVVPVLRNGLLVTN